jgi:hypothetical protein
LIRLDQRERRCLVPAPTVDAVVHHKATSISDAFGLLLV